jgi:hypothetical protein
MLVALGMPSTIVLRRASGGIRARNREAVFLDTACSDVMEMSVVQIIDVALMLDRRVSAASAVLVGMARVRCLCSAHTPLSFAGPEDNRTFDVRFGIYRSMPLNHHPRRWVYGGKLYIRFCIRSILLPVFTATTASARTWHSEFRDKNSTGKPFADWVAILRSSG